MRITRLIVSFALLVPSALGAQNPPAPATITPRLDTPQARVFVATRYDDQWTDWTSVPDNRERHEPYHRVESTLAYRLTPAITVRGSYMTRKGYVVTFWDDQVLASIVFAKRIK